MPCWKRSKFNMDARWHVVNVRPGPITFRTIPTRRGNNQSIPGRSIPTRSRRASVLPAIQKSRRSTIWRISLCAMERDTSRSGSHGFVQSGGQMFGELFGIQCRFSHSQTQHRIVRNPRFGLVIGQRLPSLLQQVVSPTGQKQAIFVMGLIVRRAIVRLVFHQRMLFADLVFSMVQIHQVVKHRLYVEPKFAFGRIDVAKLSIDELQCEFLKQLVSQISVASRSQQITLDGSPVNFQQLLLGRFDQRVLRPVSLPDNAPKRFDPAKAAVDGRR